MALKFRIRKASGSNLVPDTSYRTLGPSRLSSALLCIFCCTLSPCFPLTLASFLLHYCSLHPTLLQPNIYTNFSVPEYSNPRKYSIHEFSHITMYSSNCDYEKYNFLCVLFLATSARNTNFTQDA
jgi:hypothetical protein